MSATRAVAPAEALRHFKPYESYKDSGIEWLGKIPAHWEVRRLKTLGRVELSNVDKKSVEGEEAVQLCNYTDVYYNEKITSDLDFMSATASRDQLRRFTLRALLGAAIGTAFAMAAIAVLPAPAPEASFLTGLGFRGTEWLWPLLVPPLAALVAFVATRTAALRRLRDTT